MKNKALVFIMMVVMVLGSFACVFAETVPSLDEVTGNYTEPEQSNEIHPYDGSQEDPAVTNNGGGYIEYTGTPNGTSVTDGNGSNEFMKDLAGAGTLDTANPQAATVGQAIQKWAGIVVQILSYVAISAMLLRVALDTVYIVAPFARSFMSKGYMGNPMAGASDNASMIGSGLGGGYQGGGVFGNRMGGYNSPMNTAGQLMGQSAMNNMTQQRQLANGRIQLVSNAALNAIASESTVGVDGDGAKHPYRMYIKDMIGIFIATPIIFALAYSGVLLQVGFAIGELFNLIMLRVVNGGFF